MKTLLLSLCILSFSIVHAQNIGIGTTTPNSTALLHVDLGSSTTNGFLVTGIYDSPSSTPDLGSGSRMMFYPGKAAFRAGHVSGTAWNNINIGFFSTAVGLSTKASGTISLATGWATIATGQTSTAMGEATQANGTISTAMGSATLANGLISTAMGAATTASGDYSTAMGVGTIASGDYSTALGRGTVASGDNSTAMGTFVSTSNFQGAFVLGDNSTTTVMQSFVANGFRSRFAGGYRLLTNSAASLGVVLLPDGNSWGAISDVRLKENFLATDGEQILSSIATMSLTTWNYKEQTNKTSRHYGPMAQDFFAAFGKDALGTIGCDTLINQQDFLGVNLVAIQALEKRTTLLDKENEALRHEVNSLKARLEKLEMLLSSSLLVREGE